MKIQNALVSNIFDRSQRYFAHVTTVTLSWRVQNIVVIGRVYFTLECFEFSSNFEFDRNMLSGTGARSMHSVACNFQWGGEPYCIPAAAIIAGDSCFSRHGYEAAVLIRRGRPQFTALKAMACRQNLRLAYAVSIYYWFLDNIVGPKGTIYVSVFEHISMLSYVLSYSHLVRQVDDRCYLCKIYMYNHIWLYIHNSCMHIYVCIYIIYI